MDVEAWDDIEYGGAPPGPGNAADGEDMPDLKQAKAKTKRAPARKRPKLTVEHLEKPSGLQDVFENFPKWFAEGYRGKGHEVRDLRRLLELYQRWHPRVFPHGTYNQFEVALEKLSGTHTMKTLLQKMRQNLPDLVDPDRNKEQEQQQDQQQEEEEQQQQQQQPADGQQGAAGEHQGQAADDEYGGFGDIDDDELLELQAEAAMVAAEAAVPEAFEDFDEHVPDVQPAATKSTAKTVNTGVGSNMNTTKHTLRDWSDDDDDDEGFSRPQQQQPAATAAESVGNGKQHGSNVGQQDAAAGAAGGSDVEDADMQEAIHMAAAAAAVGSKPGRLHRQAAAAAANDSDGNAGFVDDDMEQVQQDLLDEFEQLQQQDQEQQRWGSSAQPQQQRKHAARRQMLLDDDDDGSDIEGDVAAEAAPSSGQQLDSQFCPSEGTHGFAQPTYGTATQQEDLPSFELMMDTEQMNALLAE